MSLTISRYDRASRWLHWLIAAAILLALVTGFVVEATAAPALLPVHLGAGLTAGLLSLVRLVWWWRRTRVPPLEGPALERIAARGVHLLLALVPLALASTGLGLIALAGGPSEVFGGATLPDFDDLAPRASHLVLAIALIALMVLHVAAALRHHLQRAPESR